MFVYICNPIQNVTVIAVQVLTKCLATRRHKRMGIVGPDFGVRNFVGTPENSRLYQKLSLTVLRIHCGMELHCLYKNVYIKRDR